MIKMMLAENTGDIILSVVVVIGFIMIVGLVAQALLMKATIKDTYASQRAIVSAINLLGNNKSRLLKISMDRSSFISGFSASSHIKIRRSGILHIHHADLLIDHPDSGVCSTDNACICIGSSRNFKPKNCLVLNDSIDNIYFVGDNKGLNLGQPIDSEKSYFLIATTSVGSYHLLLNITRKDHDIFISIKKAMKT